MEKSELARKDYEAGMKYKDIATNHGNVDTNGTVTKRVHPKLQEVHPKGIRMQTGTEPLKETLTPSNMGCLLSISLKRYMR